MTKPEKDLEDDQNGQGDNAFAADWVFTLAPRDQVTRTEPGAGRPLIEAQWADRQVHVVPEDVVADWASSRAAAARVEVAETEIEVSIRAIDLAATLGESGLTGDDPENVLVVEDSSGVQIGEDNRQLNIHHFAVERVRVCLDKTFAQHLAADVATSAPRLRNSVGTLDGFDAVVIRNSRGVQVGDHNHQRNVFRHVVKGLEVALTDVFSESQLAGVLDKIRDRRIGSARSDISTALHREFKRDPSELYRALPGKHNTVSSHIPGTIVEENGTFGNRSAQKPREYIGRPNVVHSSIANLEDDDLIRTIPPRAQAVSKPAPQRLSFGDDRPKPPSHDPGLRNTPSHDSPEPPVKRTIPFPGRRIG
ncbi:hypothetical protein AMES_3464 [Amycolatopsis mediterranei S699]|uniref:Uncharacterized protein n=2 Tax=Amycolatopsis mediterranei TaxID=33910 RepID=A0A0H3D717_AMYMU|nr:RIP homotypic interaction motif-containing protein [Amycolatopsis mediterranei]ADJ45289.1 hypothetical protein AMED_3503 [Amycolatopsis mediterranei U32]AEK42049.1 hypothetical protein RAM_17815 [Amycolatopsis mediterranei S699]AFO77000.1 hypothetical protein AMES_3464 [Amycolatopsis mediterranei S699]AGT84128.1 hypothetical protein B737_3464 [Amycolatopsis mediterranei RB]KDO08574.1 hypothetical protein DV26_22890 [Amycolatopsis mediterranei]